MVKVSEFEFVTVKTTLPKLPLPPNDERHVIYTERLILRTFNEDDLEGLRVLRSQPEVMIWTSTGVPDASIETTKEFLARWLPPQDRETCNWAICLKETGELLGIGGSHLLRDGQFGWPILGYMLRKEAWGKGYATEFVKTFKDIWWALPREDVEIKVDKSTRRGDGEFEEELLTAITVSTNHGSNKVMNKSKFKLVKAWQEDDLRDPTKSATLYGWTLKAGD